MTKDAAAQIQRAIDECEVIRRKALEDRDERIRAIQAAAGLRQVDVVKATGWTRETVRRILNPEAGERARAAKIEARAREAEKPAEGSADHSA